MIPVAVRLAPEAILAVSLAGALLSLVAMLMEPRSLLVISTATPCLGLSMASIFPAAMSLANRRMKVTGSVTGWFVVGASLGATTIPWLIGQLFSETRWNVALGLPLLALLTASLLLSMLFARERVLRSGKREQPTPAAVMQKSIAGS